MEIDLVGIIVLIAIIGGLFYWFGKDNTETKVGFEKTISEFQTKDLQKE